MANEDLAVAAAQAVKALSILHNNQDDLSARSAIRAAGEGRPAFWTTARYHDQRARNFLDEANNLPLAVALKLRKQSSTWVAGGERLILATLIPLNTEATKALAAVKEFV